jgi:RNA polymerase-binding transcription factor DksA
MNPNKEVQDLAVSLTVASAQLLARLQAPPAANGSRNLHYYLDKLSGILEDLEEAVDSVEGGASDLIDEEDSDDDSVAFDAAGEVLCWSCELPIPEARLEAVPGTLFCVACAANVQERHADPFEIVTERDVKRFQKKLERDAEDERLHALARRPPADIIKSRRRTRRKAKSTR